MIARVIIYIVVLLPLFGICQNVIVPDSIFKAYLVNNPSINLNNDGEIQVSEANSFSGGINIYNKGVSSLQGIESFTNLRLLNCSRNNLASIDISNNINLQSLYCNRNNLQNLDVSLLDNLCHLQCNHNNLNTIILGSNLNFRSLYCSDNNIINLNLVTVPNVYTVYCFNNPLSNLTFSNSNKLSVLKCANAQLNEIDMSTNSSLTYLDCRNNLLTNLDLSNGNTANIKFLDARGNLNLGCIEVDNVYWASLNFTLIESTCNFNTNCP